MILPHLRRAHHGLQVSCQALLLQMHTDILDLLSTQDASVNVGLGQGSRF